MTDISRSSERGSFSAKAMSRAGGDTGLADLLEEFMQSRLAVEQEPSWSENNLEYDLRSTDWMLQKARNSEVYAQNLYAAMCNNDFQKINLENTPHNVDLVLTSGYPTWSCSWRHAGGIIADMREEGDYIDWYCSGIVESVSEEDQAGFTAEQRERYEMVKQFVPEGTVTEEIEQDLYRLGWRVMPSE